jgi:hypothetical protein
MRIGRYSITRKSAGSDGIITGWILLVVGIVCLISFLLGILKGGVDIIWVWAALFWAIFDFFLAFHRLCWFDKID